MLTALAALPVLIYDLSGVPHVTGFFCGDLSISRPYHEDAVPTWVLYAVGFPVPILLIVAVESWIAYRRR
jgi:hypothetical protein